MADCTVIVIFGVSGTKRQASLVALAKPGGKEERWLFVPIILFRVQQRNHTTIFTVFGSLDARSICRN